MSTADGRLVASPLIPGVTLQARLRQQRLTVREAITLGSHLFAILQQNHAHGVLHRDVRPANIVVDERLPLQWATLTDFDLACGDRLDLSIRDQPVEAGYYVSPENAGLLDQDVDACSDLYSAGIVLFECLAGRPPFQGATVGEILRQHMTMQPPVLDEIPGGSGLRVPRALNEVVQRLLRKDPRDRYQSAAAVLADLRAIVAGLDNGVAEPNLVVGLHDRRHNLTEPAFVGRSGDLTALGAQVERARAGQGGLVFLEAESGGGKTRLLAEFAQRAAHRGVWVLRGQGVDQVAQRPFQLLAGVAEDLLAACRSQPALARRLQEKLIDQRDTVCAVWPAFGEILGTANAGLGPEAFAETRTLQALTTLVDALGDSDKPALVLLDDCQWADRLTLILLGHWWRRVRGEFNSSSENPPLAVRHVLVVAAFRTEEVAAGHLLRTLQPSAHLTLAPFGAADVQTLVESMAGPLPAEALTVVQELGGGSPFMASAVLRGLVESGALVPTPSQGVRGQESGVRSQESGVRGQESGVRGQESGVGNLASASLLTSDRSLLTPAESGWRVEPLALADISSSRHAAAFLARRLRLLPATVVRLLTVGALLGKEFDLAIATAVANQSAAEAIASLDEARRRHLVWLTAQEGKYAFVHDKLRETLLIDLPTEDRQELHRQTALYLERHHGDRHFELAYHFDAAGESERALPHALAAAEQARTQHSLEIAEQHYRIAERGAAHGDRATRYRIAEGLGDVLTLRGRYEEATPLIAAARDLAEGEGDVAKAQIEGKLGDLAIKRGDMKTAIAAIERALEQLGNKVPQWSVGFLLQLGWEVFVQVLHTLLPGLFVGRKKLEGVEKPLLVIRLLNRLAYAYWFGRGPIPCLWTHLRAMNLAEQYPPTLELAQAYSIHAPVMTLVPYLTRGRDYARRSFDIYQSLGDVWGQGQSSGFQGLVLYVSTQYEEAIEKCREAVRLLERTGDYWESFIARYHIANSLYRLGDLPAAVAEAKRIHQSGLDLGDIQSTGICLHVWVQASGGQVPLETVQTELQRERYDVQVGAQVQMANGVWLFMQDRVAEAGVVFENAIQFAERGGVENPWTKPLRPWLASTLRRQAEKTSGWEPERRTLLLKQASKVVKRALKIARTFQNDLPHALREAGLIAAMQGSSRRARQYLDESLAVAERQGARFEHAQTLLARGRLGVVLGWPKAEEEVANARQALQALGADFALDEKPASIAVKPATLSLADRFDTVLDAGRRIASALSRDTIIREVRDAALRLLRGERCLYLDFAGQPVQPDAAGGVQESGDRGPESGVRGQKSGVRGQESGVRGQESGVRGQESGVRGQESGVRGQPDRSEGSRPPTLDSRALTPDSRTLLPDFMAERACSSGKVVVFAEGQSETIGEAALLAGVRSALCVPIFVRGVAVGCFYVEHRYVAGLFGADEERLAEFIATLAGAALENAEGFSSLQDLNTTLEERVAERTKSAEARAEELARSNAELEQFAYVASHDLQEPLRMVTSYCQLLGRDYQGKLDAEADKYIGYAVDGASRMQTLINDLLAFSRVGRLGEPFQMIDCTVAVNRAVANLETAIQEKAAVVTWDSLPTVSADAGQLTQVFQNLIGNAIKFCEETPPRVHIAAEADDKLWVLSVRDNGIGIAPEHADRVFLIFKRLHARRMYPGTGIGLAICKKIVEHHGGRIWVESALGKGSVFYFSIPRKGQQQP